MQAFKLGQYYRNKTVAMDIHICGVVDSDFFGVGYAAEKLTLNKDGSKTVSTDIVGRDPAAAAGFIPIPPTEFGVFKMPEELEEQPKKPEENEDS